MALGDPGVQSFDRAFTRIQNSHIVAGMTPLMTLRDQLITSPGFRDRGGMDTSDRDHLIAHLIVADRMRRRITYNPGDLSIKDLEAKITNINEVIGSDKDTFVGEELPQLGGGEFMIPWELDGSNPNIPMLSEFTHITGPGKLLLLALDRTIESYTRLESRNRIRFLTVSDSVRMYSSFEQIYQYLMAFGGDDNRVDIVNPLPADEPKGVDDSPNRSPQGGSPQNAS